MTESGQPVLSILLRFTQHAPYSLPTPVLPPGLWWQPPPWPLLLWRSSDHPFFTSQPEWSFWKADFMSLCYLSSHSPQEKIQAPTLAWRTLQKPPDLTLLPSPPAHLSLFHLLGAHSHLPLPLSFCTHHGGSHVCAFTHVGCAAWHTFSISLHLNTIFWTHFRYLLLQEAFPDAQAQPSAPCLFCVTLYTPKSPYTTL